METFSTRQLAAIASANKTVYWIFRVQTTAGTLYQWSTGTMASSGNETVNVGAIEAPGVWTDNEWERAESFKIVNFSGITMRRSKSEAGIHAPNDVSFTVVNSGNVLTAADFIGGTVRVSLVIADATAKELCGSWRFRIKSASPYAQQIDMVCEDFLQEFMQGSYPNTRLISDIFPNVLGTVPDNLCVPEPYGTCYIPLRSVYAVDGRYYLLGSPTDASGAEVTYTITAVRSPREVGTKIEWTSAGGFAFTQYTKADAATTNWRMFQPIIADSDNDGTVDAPGLWMTGSKILDMPTKFSRSDTASITDPAEIIRRVLRNMGLLDTDLNLASFATATATFASWSLAWNFAFFYKENRPAVLARLLAMCHCALIIGEQVTLQVLSKTSQATITDAEVLKMQEVGQDTFRYSDTLAERASDSGYVAFAKSGESQDEFIKVLVPAKTTTAQIDGEIITFPGVSDTQQVQKLGTLYYQRKFLKSADVSATVKGTMLALRPDDVITVDYADYGGTYAVLIDEITINPDVSVGLACLKFSAALDDWGDLAPGAITIIDEGGITTAYMPIIAGPDAVGVSIPPNLMPGRLRVGDGTSYVVIDPNTPLRISVYAADVEVMRFGNLNGFLGYVSALYGIAVGDATNYLKYDPTNGLRIGGALSVGGSFTKDFVAPSDSDVSAGEGTLLDDNGFQTYGLTNTFGGTVVSSDGNYMATIGKYLTATGLTKRYPLNNATNFTIDANIHLYVWSGTAWTRISRLGYADGSISNIYAVAEAGIAERAAFYGDGGTLGIGFRSSGKRGASLSGTEYGVTAKCEEVASGGISPFHIIPSSSASVPTHTAAAGSFWLTSACVLYVNTDGSTTWQKVGAQ